MSQEKDSKKIESLLEARQKALSYERDFEQAYATCIKRHKGHPYLGHKLLTKASTRTGRKKAVQARTSLFPISHTSRLFSKRSNSSAYFGLRRVAT